jgi:hypothetical protein
MKSRILVTLVVVLLVLIGSLLISSCAIVKDADGGTSIRLSPATHKTIGDAGKVGVDLLSILSMFIPALVPVTAAAGAGVVTWNRMGKKVTKYKTPLEHTVAVLEDLKKDEKLWKQIKPYLKGIDTDVLFTRHPSAKTEATIRELIDDNQGAV